MAITITHPFVSPVQDEGRADEVGPDEWNASHTVLGDSTAITNYILTGQGNGVAPIWSAGLNLAGSIYQTLTDPTLVSIVPAFTGDLTTTFPTANAIITTWTGAVGAPGLIVNSIATSTASGASVEGISAGVLVQTNNNVDPVGILGVIGNENGLTNSQGAAIWALARIRGGQGATVVDALRASSETEGVLGDEDHPRSGVSVTSLTQYNSFVNGIAVGNARDYGILVGSSTFASSSAALPTYAFAVLNYSNQHIFRVATATGQIDSFGSQSGYFWGRRDNIAAAVTWGWYSSTTECNLYDSTRAANSITISQGISGQVYFTQTTASTSTTTGALRVDGGVGVAGAGYFGGNVTLTSATASDFLPELRLVNSNASGEPCIKIYHATDNGWRVRVSGAVADNLSFDYTTNNSSYTNGVITFSGTTTAASSNTTGALIVNGGVGIAGDTYLGTGTTAIAPLRFTSGTNLTTAAAGATEFDGKCLYFTAAASSRQVADTEQFTCLTADYVLTDSATAQKAFNASTNGALTLVASTSYFFEAMYLITNTGTTSHTWAVLFAGTATATELQYAVTSESTTGIALGADNEIYATESAFSLPSTATVVTGALTSATENTVIKIRGILRVNGAGTVIPQVKLSAQANGTETMLKGSYIRFWPIGTNTISSVGNWS